MEKWVEASWVLSGHPAGQPPAPLIWADVFCCSEPRAAHILVLGELHCGEKVAVEKNRQEG